MSSCSCSFYFLSLTHCLPSLLTSFYSSLALSFFVLCIYLSVPLAVYLSVALCLIYNTHTHTDTICHFIACPVSQSVCLRDYGVVCANMDISRLLYLPFYRLPSISPVSLSALSISLSPSLPAKCMTIPLSCSNQPLLPYLYRTRLAVQLCLRSQMLLSTQQRAAGQT